MVSRKQRIQFCDLSKLDAEGRQMAERATANGQVLNIFKVLLNHPKLVRNWGRFGNYILQGSTLSAREREIAILRIGWLNQAEYEWEQHVLVGKRAGLSDREIEMIPQRPNAALNRHVAPLVQAADDL